MTLYKYIKKEHLDAFFSRGSVKIGSLYEYRDIEQYGLTIGDKDEGVYETVLDRRGEYTIDLSTNTAEALFLRERLNLANPTNIIKMSDGVKIISKTNSPDCYIYCVTTEFSADIMKEFGCDSCIEIINPERFFHAISRKIRHKAILECSTEITYADKTTDYLRPHAIHPAIMKSPEYAHQKEFRVIWRPKKSIEKIKSPLFINAPKAISACRVYKP